MPLSTQPYKGSRDFYPSDKRIQKYLFSMLRSVVESYGYEEYDGPILEPLELYLAKTGEEIVKEQTYTFEDRGGRSVAIRPEMTPTVARMVASKRQELAYPLRWYSIPNLWRYERPQKGRMREHWQLNVDVFGLSGVEAETEIIQVADDIFRKFGADRTMFEIKLNSRKLMDYILGTYLGLDQEKKYTLTKLIDRKDKMSLQDFKQEAKMIIGSDSGSQTKLTNLLAILEVKSTQELDSSFRALPSVQQLEALLFHLSNLGIQNIRFDIGLVRGFDYYTDIVFEVYDTDPINSRSMFGGGRYDGLVGLFGVEPLPTVGFGMGDITLENFLRSHNLLPLLPSETDLYLALLVKPDKRLYEVVKLLRDAGLKLAVDFSSRKLGAQIKTAEKKGISKLLIVGEDELASASLTLRDLDTGQENKMSTAAIINLFKQ